MGGTESGLPCPALAARMRAADERRAKAKPDAGCASSLVAPAGWPERGRSCAILAARIALPMNGGQGPGGWRQGGSRESGQLYRRLCCSGQAGTSRRNGHADRDTCRRADHPRRQGRTVWRMGLRCLPWAGNRRLQQRGSSAPSAGPDPAPEAQAHGRVRHPSRMTRRRKGAGCLFRTGPEDGRDSRVRPAAAAARRRAA